MEFGGANFDIAEMMPATSAGAAWNAIAQYSLQHPDLLQAYTDILLELGKGASSNKALKRAVDRWSEAAVLRTQVLDTWIRELSQVTAPRRN